MTRKADDRAHGVEAEAPPSPLQGLPELPASLSDPLAAWVKDVSQLVWFVLFVASLAIRADEAVRTASKALLEYEEDEAKRTELQAAMDRGAGTTDLLRSNRHLVLQMAVQRSVDNYLTYLSELLALLFRTRPETLRSSETVPLEEVLRHMSMDELIAALAERRVERLAYLGMADL